MINLGCECANDMQLLKIVVGGFVFVNIVMFVLIFKITRWVDNIEARLIAQTSPEHKALTRAYFYKLYDEHKKEKDYDKRLDMMFKEEKEKEGDR